MKYTDLKLNPSNPRKISKEKLQQLKQSILDFPDMLLLRPIIYKDNLVIGGNMRFKAILELQKEGFEIKDAYFKDADTLTEKQVKEFIIKDNVSGGEWDLDLLEKWDKNLLSKWGLDIEEWGDEELSEEYSQKVGTVEYEPNNTSHKVSDLYIEPNKELINQIDQIENEELKKLLIIRSSYFTQFNFSKIADYYAYQANEQEQRLMEKLGLVLLDKEGLINNGFSELIDELDNTEYEKD